MTRDEAVAIIQEQLVFRTTLSSNIVANLQLAQIQLENEFRPWFLISEDSYVRTTADDDRLPIPDDFLEECDEAVLRYIPDDPDEDNPETDLVKDDYETLRSNYRDTETGGILAGEPEAYCLLGNYFRIFPTPDDEYLVRMIYYKTGELLTTNIENEWLLHVPHLLMGVAGKLMAKGPLRDMVAWSVFDEWEKTGRMLLLKRDRSRDMSNRNLQVGGPH